MGPKRYDKEFMLSVVELYKNGKKPIDICKDLNLPDSTFWGWIYKDKTHGEKAFPGSGNPVNEEMALLKKQLADAQLERDILKKAVAIFSKQQP